MGHPVYRNPIEIPKIRNNQFCVLKSLDLGEMVTFGNFVRIASLGVGFRLGTLQGYFFTFGQI